MYKKIVITLTIFFDNIFLHYSTKSNGNRQQMTVFFISRIRPHSSRAIFDPGLQNSTTFAHETCRMMWNVVKICIKRLANYNSPVFFAKFRTQEAQESTNFDKFCTQNLSKFVELCVAKLDIIRLTPGYSTIFARSWNDC